MTSYPITFDWCTEIEVWKETGLELCLGRWANSGLVEIEVKVEQSEMKIPEWASAQTPEVDMSVCISSVPIEEFIERWAPKNQLRS